MKAKCARPRDEGVPPGTVVFAGPVLAGLDELSAAVPELPCSRQVLGNSRGAAGPDPMPSRVWVVVLDLRSAAGDGAEVIGEALERWPREPFFAIVSKLQTGLLPTVLQVAGVKDLSATLRALVRGARVHRIRGGESGGRRREDGSAAAVGPHGILGESAAIRELRALVVRTAASESTVLITGETGVGKDRVARLVHHLGRRQDGPFVAVNCGAVSPTLLADELFGHEKGAFTDARTSRCGMFQAADGGTLFLDEIGETSPDLRVALLRSGPGAGRAPGGRDREIPVDVRLICDEPARGGSRRSRAAAAGPLLPAGSDQHRVPPLRDRERTSCSWRNTSWSTAWRIGPRGHRRLLDLREEALAGPRLAGNVRELQNCVERAVALAPGPWIGQPIFGSCRRLRWARCCGSSATDAPKVAADATLEGVLAKKVTEALTAAGRQHAGGRRVPPHFPRSAASPDGQTGTQAPVEALTAGTCCSSPAAEHRLRQRLGLDPRGS